MPPPLECDYEVILSGASSADITKARAQALAELAAILGGPLRNGIAVSDAEFLLFDSADPPNAYFAVHVSGLTDAEATKIDDFVGTQS